MNWRKILKKVETIALALVMGYKASSPQIKRLFHLGFGTVLVCSSGYFAFNSMLQLVVAFLGIGIIISGIQVK